MQVAQEWLSALREVVSHLRVADLLDTLLIAIFIYAAIAWLRHARARFVAWGLVATGVVYALSIALGMHLSRSLFDALIPALFVALIVIFQEDVRRGFERVALFGPRALRKVSPETLDTVVQAVVRLSEQRVGALIVLRGREPLERHLTGGIELNGRLSVPLLSSLFDPHSPGHDGAVVLEGDCVQSFAAHLPLSSAVPPEEAELRGTRHAAALGLSERSDSLVVVVSEERGTISLARNAVLWPVKHPSELAQELRAFASGHEAKRSMVPTVRRPRLLPATLKTCALVLAAVAWLSSALQQRETVVHTLELPVTYRNVPPDWLVEQPEPTRASVTLSAPKPMLDKLEPDKLALAIDLAAVEDGAHTVKIGPHNLDLDPEIAVQRVEPARVRVIARKTELRELPIVARLEGQPPGGRVVTRHEVTPPTLKLLVARDVGTRVTHVKTEPVALGEIRESTQRDVAVLLPEGTRLAPEQTDTVGIRIDLAEPRGPDS